MVIFGKVCYNLGGLVKFGPCAFSDSVKILKFLHASNFRLHLPVTCWSAEEDCVSDSGLRTGAEAAALPDSQGKPSEGIRDFGFWSQGSSSNWLMNAAFPDLTPGLMEECLSAAWQSAERVFDLAINQSVDFVLLTGDVLQPNLTGTRGLVFLVEQFRRLHEKGIAVYWKLERPIEAWMLPDFSFPENVFLFPATEPHIKKFRLPDSSKNIFIASWCAPNPDFSHYDFSRLPGQKLPQTQTIALCPDDVTFLGNHTGPSAAFPKKKLGTETDETKDAILKAADGASSVLEEVSEAPGFRPEANDFPIPGAAYVAMTAIRERLTLKRKFENQSNSIVFHSPGEIQYRSPGFHSHLAEIESKTEIPPAGVSVVNLDLDGEMPPSIQFFPTETLGWSFLEERLPADAVTWEKLQNFLVQTLRKKFSSFPSENLFSSSSIESPIPDSLRGSLAAEPEERAASTSSSTSIPAPSSRIPFELSRKRTLVFWKLVAEKPVHAEMLRDLLKGSFSGDEAEEYSRTKSLLAALRAAGECLSTQPWTVCISADRAGLIPYSWGQSDSMLGDFLRLVRFHLGNSDPAIKNPEFADHSLNLREMLTEAQNRSLPARMTALETAEENVILELAAVWGADALACAQEGRKK